MAGSIGRLIIETLRANALWIAFAALLSTVAVAIMIRDALKRRNKYRYWTKDTINLVVFTREWARTEDELLIELFERNQRLEAENKALRKQYSQLSLVVVVWVVILLVFTWFAQKVKSVKAWSPFR